MKRIAYLIFAHDNYEHLKRLINSLDSHNSHFYLHIDQKSELPINLNSFKNLTIIKNRLKIYWAGYSLVQATLNLMEEAIQKDYDYYIVISGADYPIRPNEFLYKRLEEGGEFISIRKGYSKDKPKRRISQYYYEYYNRRDHNNLKTILLSKLETLLAKFIKRSFPFGDIYHGPDWYGLSKDCVSYILTFTKNNPDFVKFYTSTLFPSESFFHTIIGNSKFKSDVRMYLTYTDWSKAPSPALIGKEHIDILTEQTIFNTSEGDFTPFFARKFDDNSADIVNIIESRLRCSVNSQLV
jgi:hypothetical protein